MVQPFGVPPLVGAEGAQIRQADISQWIGDGEAVVDPQSGTGCVQAPSTQERSPCRRAGTRPPRRRNRCGRRGPGGGGQALQASRFSCSSLPGSAARKPRGWGYRTVKRPRPRKFRWLSLIIGRQGPFPKRGSQGRSPGCGEIVAFLTEREDPTHAEHVLACC